jgi:cation:H+ antiporter
MWIQLPLFILGLVALYFGAEWVVRGAARLARSLGISALVVGLTVVSLGTSAPELVVSVLAATRGQADLAVGNVIGSNVLNVALILGVTALVQPLQVQIRLIAREIPLMLAATLVALALAWNGTIGRIEGAVLLAGLFTYLSFIVLASRREPETSEAEYDEFETATILRSAAGTRLRNVGLIVIGLVALVLGARLVVDAALVVARVFGITEVVVGLTIVAVGTSLPELATSVIAAVRREADIALGNAVGSNIFNLLAVFGVASLVQPLPVDPALFRFEIPVMVLTSALLLPLAWTRLRLERWEGALLLAGYIVFTSVLIVRNTAL